jgi:hypothetical protein
MLFCWFAWVAIGVPEVDQHPTTSVLVAAGIQKKEINLRRTMCVEESLTTH